jgi:glutathione S-transferase
MITISAFKMVPPFAQGVVRDLRVRWALEEAGLPYKTKLIDPTIQGTAEYRALQPFGQVPIYEEDGLKLFESGSILLHIASRCPELMPADEVGRARATTWVFAALNSIEPFAQHWRRSISFTPVRNGQKAIAQRSREWPSSGWRNLPHG